MKLSNRDNGSQVKNSLLCLYTNADQLKNKLLELESRISDKQPNVIGITEVKPKNSSNQVNPAEYTILSGNEYQMFSKNIDNEVGRGLILYIHRSLQATEVKFNTEFQENLFVKVRLNASDEILIGLIYRSESGSDYNNLKIYDLITESVDLKCSHYLVMGDFNYPRIDWSSWSIHSDNVESSDFNII